MNDTAGLSLIAAADRGAANWAVFVAVGERFAVPLHLVEAVGAPPVLTAVPYAPAALLGAANLAGQILPIIDIAPLLGRDRGSAGYDGSGEIVRLRDAGGTVGIWVDRVERLGGVEPGAENVTRLDPAPLLASGLAAPALGATPDRPLGEVGELAAPEVAGLVADSVIVVKIAGKSLHLARSIVVELLDTVPWTRLPRAPAGFWGIGLLRGSALPILSLASGLGTSELSAPGNFVLLQLEGRPALLAIDELIGLQFDEGSADEARGEALDVATAISAEVRQIVFGFSPAERDVPATENEAAAADGNYLAFTIGGQDFALPIRCIERVIGPQSVIAMPAAPEAREGVGAVAAAIELRGQLIPIADLRSRLGLAAELRPEARENGGYLILRAAVGGGAVAIDRVTRLVALRPEDIVQPPTDERVIEGMGTTEQGALLRIVAPDRLWGG